MSDDDVEKLEAGTHPLPYVQNGMVLRVAGDTIAGDPRLWRVVDIYEDRHERTAIVLRLIGDILTRELPSELVRRRYELGRDFDPNLPGSAETQPDDGD